MEKAVVCFSGGHSSALVAIAAVRRFGKGNVMLVNDDISPEVEDQDIKRFKDDVANYLDIDIKYANAEDWEIMTPLKVAKKKGVFQFCSSYLKTEPFKKWLAENFPASFDNPNKDVRILYGFDANETARIQWRSSKMAAMGYYTDYPLRYWDIPVQKTEDIGIPRPKTYERYKHANCQGCLKAGRQHWYSVFCTRPDLWQEARGLELVLGYSIIKGVYLNELEDNFYTMKYDKKICPGEKMTYQAFWAKVKRVIKGEEDWTPCECSL